MDEMAIPVTSARDAAGRGGVFITMPQGWVVFLPPSEARDLAARIVAAAAEVDGARRRS